MEDHNQELNLGWNNCHIDIWFSIARFIRPEDTLTFAQICKKTKSVVESELYWSRIYEKYILAKYPWLDKPKQTEISCIRDETIRELFKTYLPFTNRRKDPDNYDEIINKCLVRVHHNIDEKFNFRCYAFQVRLKFTNFSRLAKLNRHEGCQLLVVKTNKFIEVPYECQNLIVKSISKTLSKGFRAYKLKIEFCDHFGLKSGETLIFDPIINLQLYNWWDENYEKFMKLNGC